MTRAAACGADDESSRAGNPFAGSMLTRLNGLARAGLGRRLAIATLSSGAIWAAGTLATFGVGVVLARWLGPAGYGVYGTAIAIVTLVAVPAQFGLPLLATREISAANVQGRADEAASLARWFVAIVTIASIVLAAGLWIATRVLPLAVALKPALAIASGLLPALALSGLAAGLLRGQERVVASQLLDVLVRPVLFVALLLAWSTQLGVTQAILAQTGAAAAIAALGFAMFFRRTPLRPGAPPPRVRVWTAAAVPMMLLEGLRAVDGSYGVLIAGYVASLSDAGLLRVATASAMIAAVPVSLQNIVVAPHLAAAHAAGETQRLGRIVAGSTLFMTLAVGAVTIVVAAAGQWALPLAFGPAFAGACWPLLVLCLNQLLAAALGPAIILLSMTGHERVVAQAFAVSVVVAVAAALVLTPRFGAVGTAGSAVIATAIRGLILNRVARSSLGVSPSILGAIRLFGSGLPRSAKL